MKRRLARAGIGLVFSVLIACFLLSFGVSAEEGIDVPREFHEFLDALPDEVREILPDGVEADDAETVGDAVEELSDYRGILRAILSLSGVRLEALLPLFAAVCGVLILSALCRAVGSSLRSTELSDAFSFCSTLVVTAAILALGYREIGTVTAYFERLNRMTEVSIPLMSAAYALGGNVSTAVASGTGLHLSLILTEEVIGSTILPFCGICLSLSLVGILDPSTRTGTAVSTLKKNYTTILSFLMMILLATISAQSVLGARRDSLAMKSVRFTVGSAVPVLGGSVSELTSAVGNGVSYLRGTVGICAVLLLCLVLLPTVIELFLCRLLWLLSASLAELLGCDPEKRLLEEFASLCGYLIAAACICSSVFFLTAVILVHTASVF